MKRSRILFASVFVTCCLTGQFLAAQDKPVIKVDFNEPSRTNMLEVLEPGFTPWPVAKDCHEASLTVDGVTFAVESESNMRVGWNKAFVQTATENVRLIGDGLNLDPKEMDGTLTLKIKGLPAGTHSIKTYHNSWQDPERYCTWDIHVYCNGDSLGGVKRTMRKSLAEAAASMMISFTVDGPADVTVLEFKTDIDEFPDNVDEKTSYEVTPILNGFELNTANIVLDWVLDQSLNGAGAEILDKATRAVVTDRNIPAPFLFVTSLAKGEHLDWSDALDVYIDDDTLTTVSMCGLTTNVATVGTEDDMLDFVFSPQLSVRYLPKVLKMSLAFNEQSANEYVVLELLQGDTYCFIDTVYADQPARQRLDLEYLLYTKGCTEYLSGDFHLRIRLHAPQPQASFFVGRVVISGDGTEADRKVWLASTKVSPKAEYGYVKPAASYYIVGQTVTFQAVPSKGYKFRQWEYDGQIVSLDNPLVCTQLNSDTLLTAVFETANSYTLNCTVEGGDEQCRVRMTPDGEEKQGQVYYQEGINVMLSAYPSGNLYFSHWEDRQGKIIARTNPARIVMNRNYDVVAVFTEKEVLPLRAFPTAEGYGRNVTGGRGGQVVEVTNLSSDAGVQGSLLWALKQYPGQPLTVVFRVSGIIESDDRYITLGRSNVTYAGQTAPGDGICFRKSKVKINGNNVIVRNLRFRVGDELGLSLSAIGIENCNRVIVDHCSISWSAEENVTMYDNDSTTMQYCIISEPLYDSYNSKGDRAYGSQWGGEPASYLHNLMAHCKTRAPRFNGSSNNDLHSLVDVRNNVFYNCGDSYGGEIRNGGVSCFNQLVANYYRSGPVTGPWFVSPSSPYGKWYIVDNFREDNEEANRNNWKAVNVNAAVVDDICSELPGDDFLVFTETAEEAYRSVLAGAGAFPRDTLDRRVVNEAAGVSTPMVVCNYGKAGIIDTPTDVDGWPVYRTAEVPVDSDHDGMPDTWELDNGLNPNDPTDRNKVTSSGYTCLEVYLNGLMGERIRLDFPTGVNTLECRPASCYYNAELKQLYFNAAMPVVRVDVCGLDGCQRMSLSGSDLRQVDFSGVVKGLWLVRMTESSGRITTCKVINR